MFMSAASGRASNEIMIASYRISEYLWKPVCVFSSAPTPMREPVHRGVNVGEGERKRTFHLERKVVRQVAALMISSEEVERRRVRDLECVQVEDALQSAEMQGRDPDPPA